MRKISVRMWEIFCQLRSLTGSSSFRIGHPAARRPPAALAAGLAAWGPRVPAAKASPADGHGAALPSRGPRSYRGRLGQIRNPATRGEATLHVGSPVPMPPSPGAARPPLGMRPRERRQPTTAALPCPPAPSPSSFPGGPRLRRHVVGLTPPREAEEEAAAPAEQALTGGATGTGGGAACGSFAPRPASSPGEGRRGASSGGAELSARPPRGPSLRARGGGLRLASALPCRGAPVPAVL